MPKNRCEFHIVQKVGSVLEEENQRGLAHFLEHMAFNGTKHFPGKSLINYLESNGLQFGTNINAYTSIDETIYSLTDVPARQALVDSCVLILHDWAGCITLDPKEIDAERKVIHEEWRTKNSAQSRMYEATLKQLFPEDNPYGTRLPIGLMSVVDNFEHKALRDYYRKWYRPDLQGIIIVGDINVDEVEKTIHRLWRDIKKPVNPAPRTYFSVPDNTEPIVATAYDKEANRNTLKLSYKRDDTPDSMRCDVNVMRDEYITSMASMLLDMRLKTTAEDYRGIM
jgi:zinc protease